MRTKLLFPLLGAICLLAVSALAQGGRSEASLQGTANFTSSTNDLFSSQPATRSGGVLAGYRYHLLPWFSLEGDYAYTRNRQNFFDPTHLTSGLQTHVHELTGALVLTPGSRHRLRPYGLVGGGAIIFRPASAPANAVLGVVNRLGFGDSGARPAFLYGLGVDVGLTESLAVRAEYRGLLFDAPGFSIPGLSILGSSTPGITHMAQPSAGIVWRF